MVDVNSVMCPHFYWHDARSTPERAPGSFFDNLKVAVEEVRPTHLVMAFDPPKKSGPTVRAQLYAEYKAGRKTPPAGLSVCRSTVWKNAQAVGLCPMYVVGYEADDVIATLATSRSAAGCGVVLYARDKDIAQLVTDKIQMVDVRNTEQDGKVAYTTGRQAVKDRYGVWPEQIVDYLSMVGDQSDNIPGVRGIGEVAARALLTDFHNWEGIVKQAKEAPSSKRSRQVIDGQTVFMLARSLVRSITSVPISYSMDAFRMPDNLDWKRLIS